jgi:hypothetical protein
MHLTIDGRIRSIIPNPTYTLTMDASLAAFVKFVAHLGLLTAAGQTKELS